jgi:hypothetical protein
VSADLVSGKLGGALAAEIFGGEEAFAEGALPGVRSSTIGLAGVVFAPALGAGNAGDGSAGAGEFVAGGADSGGADDGIVGTGSGASLGPSSGNGLGPPDDE